MLWGISAVCLAGGPLTPEGERFRVCFSDAAGACLAIVAPPALQEASDELAHGLQAITGKEFPIVAEAPSPQAKLHLELDSALPPQGFRIAPLEDGDGLAIAGGSPQGVLHGVLALLEEDLGCRWYGRGLEHYPRQPELTAAVATRTDAPRFAWRAPFTALAYDKEFCRRNRVVRNSNDFDHLNGWFCHTYEKILPPQEFQAHPEWFMMDADGQWSNHQPCPSTPEFRRRAKARALEALRANRDATRYILSISENDNHDYCHCPQCLACMREHGGAAVAPQLEAVNEVARAVANEFPKAIVEFLAYHFTQQPPTGMAVEPNVQVWFCITDEREYGDGVVLRIEERPPMAAHLDGWAKLVTHLRIWDYNVDFRNYFLPVPSFGALADNLRHYHSRGIDGVMVLDKREDIGGDRCEKRAWVQSKLLWNPERDCRALMRDFNAGVYGAAAPMMDEYDELVEAAGAVGQPVFSHYGREEFLRRAAELFNRAETALREAGQEEVLPRLELARLPILVFQLEDLAARLDTPAFDADRFTKWLELLARVTEREKLTHFSERDPMRMHVNDYQVIAQARKGDGTVRFLADTMVVWPQANSRRVDDPKAIGGRAAIQPYDDNWTIQRDIPSASLVPGRRYQLRCHVRSDLPAGDTRVWLAGIHVNGRPEASFSRFFTAAEVASDEYQWVTVGEPFLPQPNSYFYGAGVANPARPGFFHVDAVELVPVP